MAIIYQVISSLWLAGLALALPLARGDRRAALRESIKQGLGATSSTS